MESNRVLIYEMYPASWGSFAAMTEHLPRLRRLEVNYIWLAPFYPSGGVDGGYDVTDYCAIDPRYGTMEDFDQFVATANSLGMNVLIDLILNHTSDQHPWFQASVRHEGKYADYYHWVDCDLGWGNLFDGKTAFTQHPQRGQYYLHLYHPGQPDLNWDNHLVMNEFREIIRFWTHQHRVDGFRIDSASFLGKTLQPAYLPRRLFGALGSALYYLNRAKTVQIYRRLFTGTRLFTIGEFSFLRLGTLEKFVSPVGPLSAGFNVITTRSYDHTFGLLKASPDMLRLERTLAKWSRCWGFAMALESHDEPRFLSRTGADIATELELLFGHGAELVCLYQGQELGLENPNLGHDISNYRDIQTIMRYETAIKAGKPPEMALAELAAGSRDNARQPLPLAEYEKQLNDPNSPLNQTIQAIQKWKSRHRN